MRRPLACFAALVVATVTATPARAEDDGEAAAPAAAATTPAATPAPAPPAPKPTPAELAVAAELDRALPPPSNVIYLQYGVAFSAENVLSAGPMCDNAGVPCILGQGGGVAARAGWRSNGAVYLGVAYAFSKQDPNKLYRLAILQQLRAEGRYYFDTGRELQPYAAAGGGLMAYGNEWGVDTLGPAGSVGGGLEAQITRRTVVGLALTYRAAFFSRFVDTSGTARDAGGAQFLTLELTLEHRDPIR